MVTEVNDLFQKLRSGLTHERVMAALRLGNEQPAYEIIEALKNARISDPSYDVRRAAALSIRKHLEIIRLAGANRVLSDISDDEFTRLKQRRDRTKFYQNMLIIGVILIIVAILIVQVAK